MKGGVKVTFQMTWLQLTKIRFEQQILE
jgi:hypothetical protein